MEEIIEIPKVGAFGNMRGNISGLPSPGICPLVGSVIPIRGKIIEGGVGVSA